MVVPVGRTVGGVSNPTMTTNSFPTLTTHNQYLMILSVADVVAGTPDEQREFFRKPAPTERMTAQGFPADAVLRVPSNLHVFAPGNAYPPPIDQGRASAHDRGVGQFNTCVEGLAATEHAFNGRARRGAEAHAHDAWPGQEDEESESQSQSHEEDACPVRLRMRGSLGARRCDSSPYHVYLYNTKYTTLLAQLMGHLYS